MTVLHVAAPPGAWWAVATQAGRAVDLWVHLDHQDARIGEIHAARVRRIDPATGAFLDIADGGAFLPLDAVRRQRLTEGAAVTVRLARPALAEKLPRATTRLALPGATVTLFPGRGVPPEILADLLPGDMGAETAAGADPDALRAEAADLMARYKRFDSASAPALLWRDAPPPAPWLRRHDGPVRAAAPGLVAGAEVDPETWPLIAETVEAALAREVPVAGGRLTFERTRALTAIDVDGGAGGPAVNAPAAAEIARQLRLRHLGGVMAIDFVDVSGPKKRAAVADALRTALADDPAPHRVLAMSPLGLVEMVRKYTDIPLEDRLSLPLDGGGRSLAPWHALAALAAITRGPAGPLVLRCSPRIADLLAGDLAPALAACRRPVTVAAEAGRADPDLDWSAP